MMTMTSTRPATREPLWKVDGDDGLATYLETSRDTVYRMIREGHLRSVRVGRFVRVPDSALRDFIASGGSQHPFGIDGDKK